MGNLIIKGGKGAAVGIKIASQNSKGAPKDGNFEDISPATENPGCPYTNPSKAEGLKIPQK